MKKILLEVKENIINTDNSVLFWNSVLIIALIALAMYNMDLFWIVQGLASLILLACMIDDKDFNFWNLCTVFMWLLIIAFVIGVSVRFIYKNTIVKFNDWLDKSKNNG